MSKMIMAMGMAFLAWVLPLKTGAAYVPNGNPVTRTTLVQTDLSVGVVPASARISIHVGSRGSFAFGRFGGRGFNRFGDRRGFPHRRFNGFGRDGLNPFIGQEPAFRMDPVFQYNAFVRRFGPGSSSLRASPFGARRPGW